MSSEVPKKVQKRLRQLNNNNNRIQQFIKDIIQILYLKPFNVTSEAAYFPFQLCQ